MYGATRHPVTTALRILFYYMCAYNTVHTVVQMADLQKEAIAEAYEDVRNDLTATTWFVVLCMCTVN